MFPATEDCLCDETELKINRMKKEKVFDIVIHALGKRTFFGLR